jgi:hypothetical protein
VAPKFVVISMIMTLFGLFIWSKYFVIKQKNISNLEIDYITPLKKWKQDSTDINLRNIIEEAGLKFGKSMGMSDRDIEKMIKSDLSRESKA